MDTLVYADLQRGEARAAQQVLDALQTNPPVEVEDLAGAYDVAAIPARYALEGSRWAEAGRAPTATAAAGRDAVSAG